MNYNDKFFNFSPPNQYMANVQVPYPADIPFPVQLTPVEYKQGIIQASPSNPQMFWNSPTHPSPFSWNFQPPSLPPMATNPYVDRQSTIPTFRRASPFQTFDSSVLHPCTQYTPKVQSKEFSFKIAALRNGIKVEKSPQKGKEEKCKRNSKETLSTNDKNSACHQMFPENQKQHSISSYLSSFSTTKRNEEGTSEVCIIKQTCSVTNVCFDMVKEQYYDNFKVNKPKELGGSTDHVLLNSKDLYGEKERQKREKSNDTGFPREDMLEDHMCASLEVKECASNALHIAPFEAQEGYGGVEETKSNGSLSNDVLIEEFVQSIIHCAVVSLLKEKENEKNCELEKVQEDVEEDEFVSSETLSVADSRENKQNITDPIEEINVPRAAMEEEIKAGGVSADNGLLPYLTESMVTPAELTQKSVVPLPNLMKEMPTQAELIMSQGEGMTKQAEPMLNQAEAIQISGKMLTTDSPKLMGNSARTIIDLEEATLDQVEAMSVKAKVQDSLANKCNVKCSISKQDAKLFVDLFGNPPESSDVKPALVPVSSEKENTKSSKDSALEDLFVNIALKKGIKVGSTCLVNEGNTQQHYNDKNIEENFKRLALRNGIRVRKPHLNDQCTLKHNSSEDVKPALVPVSSEKENTKSSKDSALEDLFVNLALKKEIEVGSTCLVNEGNTQQQYNDKNIEENFERLALRNGIRVRKPHLNEQHILKRNSSAETKSWGKTDSVDQLVHKDNIEITPSFNQLNMTTPVVPSNISDKGFCLNVLHPFTSDNVIPSKNTVKCDYSQEIDLTNNSEPKVEVETQTIEKSFTSQETQTVGVRKDVNVAVQVDVMKEAFKAEYDEWVQEELRLIDPKVSSVRELSLVRKKACIEAERRLAMEMDENFKLQRETKIMIDKLRDNLADKEETIEKMSKELKTLKKQKENEIKRLAKELKQKEEDLKSSTHQENLKDLVIENMKEISREQNHVVEQMKVKIKEMEWEMQYRQKISNRIEQAEDFKQQFKATDQWQIVQHPDAKHPRKSLPQYQQTDCLSYFDDEKFDMFTVHPTVRTSACSFQQDPCEKIQHSETGMLPRNLGFNMSKTNIQSFSGDCVPQPPACYISQPISRPRESSAFHALQTGSLPRESAVYVSQPGSLPREYPASYVFHPGSGPVCSLGTSQPAPAVYVPRLPKKLHPESVSPPVNTFSTSTLNPNMSSSAGAHGTAVSLPDVLQTLTKSTHQTLTVNHNTQILPSDVLHLEVPDHQHGFPNNNSDLAYDLKSSASKKDLYRVPYPTPASSCDSPSTPPGVTVDPALREAARLRASTKGITTNKFLSFDKLMEALRESFPEHPRPALMVYLKKAKESFGIHGFKGKQIAEIVDKVGLVINRDAFLFRHSWTRYFSFKYDCCQSVCCGWCTINQRP